jgi:hypothetical protein
MARLDRVVTGAAALVMVLLGFLPIANWIRGGPAIPGWADLLGGWWSGTAIVGGVALVVVLLTRGRPEFPGQLLLARLIRSYETAPWPWTVGTALVAGLIYLAVAWGVLSGKPLLVDELAQVFQARIYAGGALTLPSPAYPEFFSTTHVLNYDGRVFSQFPAGAPAMLALGTLLGAEWVIGPLFGAVSVLLFGALVRRIEPRPGVAFVALLLFAFAPFVAFMSGSHMNHVTGLTWTLLGMLGLARVVTVPAPGFRDGLLLGLGFGIAGSIRPIDAAVFALPAGFWLLMRTIRSRAWATLAGAGLGIVVPIAALLVINARTTGSPLTFGYIALWGASHDVGFHVSPYGEAHTVARGLELINLYFVRLQSYLFETPFPSLLPAVTALVLTRRLSPFDRYLFATAAMLVGFYLAYWHDGFFLGPRFMIPLVPFLALWSARSLSAVRERLPSPLVPRGIGLAVVGAVILAIAVSVPMRVRVYRNGLLTMRWDADAAAARAGVVHALVFVRESWGAQLVARMWAAGVPASVAEQQYRRSDACALERALDRIERQGLRSDAAVAELTPLLRDAARLIRSPFTVDPTNNLLPGSIYTAECLQRLRDDGAGFTLYGPLLLARRRDIVYARDLHARDTLLVQQYPDRALYLLRPPTTEEGAPPMFYPLRRDSLVRAWRVGE